MCVTCLHHYCSKKSPNGLASPEPGQEYKKLEIANINSALDVQRDVRSRSPRSAEVSKPMYPSAGPVLGAPFCI